MSNYISLARKWRPKQFTDVVGQSAIIQTLSQAISKNRVHCGYLFTGSRGIGKTSIARIFAKNLRCEHTQIKEHTIVSCDQCSHCHEIALSTSIDVIEIDGASNNGVDAVRDLREGARFLPSSGKRKIYIIDEVHMLTTQAFNALLKTLEEPPEHIVFIFATTEPHKIPATILSRCQRFDFKKPTPPQIRTRLIEVLQKEKIEFEEGAIRLISQAAEGSLRDALSLLDQVIAYAGEFISTQSVHESIGMIKNDVIFQVLESIFKRTPVPALGVIEGLYNEGHDLKVFIKSFLEHLHTIVLIKVGGFSQQTSAYVDYTPEEADFLKARAEDRSLEEIELIFQVFHYGLELLSHSPFPKIILDFLVIKTALAEGFISEATKTQTPSPSPQLPSKPMPLQKDPSPLFLKRKPADPILENETQTALSSSDVSPGVVTPLRLEPMHLETPEALIPFIAQKRPLLASLLEHAYHFVLEEPKQNGTQKVLMLKIYFLTADAYKKDQLSTPLYMKQLIDFSQQFFNHPVELFLEVKDEDGKFSFAAVKLQSGQAHEEKIRNEIENNPIIQEAQSLFGSKVGAIRIIQPQNDSHLGI